MDGFKTAAFADEAADGLDGQINALRRNGIGLLELRNADGVNVARLGYRKALNAASKLRKAGIGVWSIGSPIGKIGIYDDFGPHAESFRRCLDMADIFGAKHIRIFSFYVDPAEKQRDREGVFGRVAERLSEFVDMSRGRGIVLCHENEKGIFGERPADCLLIHREFPEIRAVFDPANYLQVGEATLPAFEMLRPYVEYMHIKDLDVKSGEVVPPGCGDGFIPELIGLFGGGTLTLEPHLKVFKGLAELERKGGRSAVGNAYASRRAAFDAAAKALKKCVESK
ncbi:MAG: sugar phosphate isomerase/epimerase [Clostridia bacterium]|nr:sugar phosphate isomerase/epimerase [Clostridia bacterium]